MNTATNIAFTLLIKVKGRLKEFNFLKRKDDNYDTDTNDEYGNRHIFRMINTPEGWKISGKSLPGWLTESESIISEALQNKSSD